MTDAAPVALNNGYTRATDSEIVPIKATVNVQALLVVLRQQVISPDESKALTSRGHKKWYLMRFPHCNGEPNLSGILGLPQAALYYIRFVTPSYGFVLRFWWYNIFVLYVGILCNTRSLVV